jgi:tetratricopeptide (TPR) repeat protein
LIRARAGGNPFFIEEVVQSLVEAGNLRGERGAYSLVRPVEAAAVPASVQAILSARIDRLPAVDKGVLQAAAVIGKEFSEPLLGRVAGLQQNELEDALRTLVAAEFIYEQELYPEAVYAFVHPLTQEVAYGSQLGRRRAALHAEVATAIAEHHPDRLDEQAALLAEHWRAADQPLEAARWHARAAAWSGTSDPIQSLRHWREVQRFADALPESPETTALGLTARIFRLQYAWRLGISHEEAETVFHEAEQMASKAGDIRSRAILLAVYGSIVGVGDGDLPAYAELGRRAVALAEESGDPMLYMAVAPCAYALFCISEFREGIAILDRAIELSGGDPTLAAGMVVGCPLAFCHVFKGGIASYLGNLDEAHSSIEVGMKLARENGDIETVGWGHMWATWLAYLSGDFEAVLSHAQQAVEIAERLGDSFSRAWAWSWLGIAYRVRDQWQESIEALERAMTISRDRHTAVEGTDWRLALLAESMLGAGDPERARALAAESVELAHARGRSHFEALALLSFARVLQGSAGRAASEEIEAVLARALQLTRETEGRVLEPMVHVELAELASLIGDEHERQRELAEAYRGFSEIGARDHAERLAGELAISAG